VLIRVRKRKRPSQKKGGAIPRGTTMTFQLRKPPNHGGVGRSGPHGGRGGKQGRVLIKKYKDGGKKGKLPAFSDSKGWRVDLNKRYQLRNGQCAGKRRLHAGGGQHDVLRDDRRNGGGSIGWNARERWGISIAERAML